MTSLQTGPSFIFDSPASDVNSAVFNETPPSLQQNGIEFEELQKEVILKNRYDITMIRRVWLKDSFVAAFFTCAHGDVKNMEVNEIWAMFDQRCTKPTLNAFFFSLNFSQVFQNEAD